ncbi:MAG: transporter substrate-binding domain-containing protein, partial [Shewanella xiamenensis]|nr:transporter substrate-binding domain-containing protein [Shewanella xiamenensis]
LSNEPAACVSGDQRYRQDQFGQGISHRLIEAAFKQAHIEVNSLVVPYSRALMMAEKGAVDGVFNVTREASTEQRFVFGNTPLFIAKASFYQRKQRPLIAENKWKIPKGSIIGVIKSYEYGDEFPELVKQRQLNLVTVATQQQLINLLLIGRIDAAVMFDLVAQEKLQNMGVTDEVIAAFNNHSSNIYLAFSKQNPKSTLLAQALDQGLAILKENGQYQQLLSAN